MREDLPEGAEGENAGSSGGGLQAEIIRSYLSFARRAIRPRWTWVVAVFATGLLLTGVALRYLPRTYRCTTVLMALSNPVLDANYTPGPLAGAQTLITRQENLEMLVRDNDLVKRCEARRPPLQKLQNRVIQAVFGQWSPSTQVAILVGTLQSKLSVGTDPAGNLQITVDWSDAQTAAEVAEAAREGFLRVRHSAEISAFEAKMSILDEHATRLRAEVEELAEQVNTAHQQQTARLTKAEAAAVAAAPIGSGAPTTRYVVRAPSVDMNFGAQLPEHKAKLAELQQQLSALENDRNQRIREEQNKLAELKLHFTPSHPQVVTQEERIAIVSQIPSTMAMLRSEVADLQSTIKQREALVAHGSSTIAGGPSLGRTASGVPASLPPEVIQALESEKTDPALSAQISGAVVRYGALRDEMRAGRMELDTAQAAFDHRYQIVVPAEVPQHPVKPKPAVIVGAGLAISILLALLLPLVAELRRGIMIERWQVAQMQLPVLAELHLPPHSD